MKIDKKIVLVFTLSFIIYLLSDILFPDILIYLIGGLIGGIVNELFNSSSNNLFLWIWSILLIVSIILFYRVKKKNIFYILFSIIFLLLVLFDFILMEIVNFKVVDVFSYYSNLLIRVFCKSSFLTTLFYFRSKFE